MMVACGASSVAVACRLATPPDMSGSEGSCIPSPTPLLIDQLKQDLKLAADNNDEALGISICHKLEKLNITKEQLEATRIGAVVNEIRKSVAKECPKFSVACRELIKTWRKQTETYTRSGSSCGGSNGVTPSMGISPALKRLVTPQTPHRLADGLSKSQVSSPSVENVIPSTMSSGNLVAQAVEKVQQYNGFKRKIDAAPSKDEVPFKRSKSALIPNIGSPQLSLSAVRRDAQSTAELVAQLSENLPTTLAPDLSSTKSNSLSPPVIKLTRVPASQPIIQEEKREKRKYTKRAAKFFKNASDSTSDLLPNNGIAPAELSLSKLKISKKPVTIPSAPAKKVDWYASIPSLEELQKRAQEKIATKSQNVTKPFIENVSGREVVCLPFVDVGIPDVVEYNYPAEENPKIECPYPRAARYALKGI